MKLRVAVMSALVCAGLLSQQAFARPPWARQNQDQDQPQQQAPQQDDRRNRGDRAAAAARQAQRANGGGRVLSVEPEGSGFRVKVLKDGEVRTHHVEGN